MGQKDGGEVKKKTETIKERSIYVYLPSHEMVKAWKKRAKKQGASISKFVIEHVENSLQQEEDTTFKPRGDLIKEIHELKNQLKEVKEDNRQKRIVIERLENELRRYRAEVFLEERFEGVRKYEKELIDILKRRGVVDGDELIRDLNIDPRESDLVKAVSKQLESLETYGLIVSTKRGWRWQGMSFDSVMSDHNIRSNRELIDEFHKDCELQDLTNETIRRYMSCILIFQNDFLAPQQISLVEVDKETLKEFLYYLMRVRKVNPKTIEAYFSALSSLYEYLEFEGYILKNVVLAVRKRYLRHYKNTIDSDPSRKLISVEDIKILINSILDARDKAIVTLLAKTGIRRGELISIDLDDIDWIDQTIFIKPKRNRTNRLIYFDDETARILKRWIQLRVQRGPKSNALFIGEHGERLKRNGIYTVVTKHAQRVGLHNPNSNKMEDHFSPHCCRHWFTTHLRRAGMKREFTQELRGDRRRDAIDIYDHIDKEELREAYLAHIPQLGV